MGRRMWLPGERLFYQQKVTHKGRHTNISLRRSQTDYTCTRISQRIDYNKIQNLTFGTVIRTEMKDMYDFNMLKYPKLWDLLPLLAFFVFLFTCGNGFCRIYKNTAWRAQCQYSRVQPTPLMV